MSCLPLKAQSTEAQPLVSVIIPAYNAEAFIAQTLESLITQIYQNFEVLVVDDGSQDRTAEIVQKYVKQDERIQLLQQHNAGVAAARNWGIEKSIGEFVAFVDADDIWYPHHIERQIQCFLNSPSSVGLVYAWSVDIDEHGVLMGGLRAAEIEGNIYKTLICHNFLGNASASMMRRICLEQVGGYDSSLRLRKAQGCEDWDLYLRIAELYEFRTDFTFSVGYRKLSGSMSSDYHQMARSHALVMETLRQRYSELPSFLFRLSASNLYFYFAHQSQRESAYSTTFFWLGKAIKADLLTCWIRLGLYRLTIKSIWAWGTAQLLGVSSQNSPSASTSPLTLDQIVQRKWTIALMLEVGNRFHQMISWSARQPLDIPKAPTLTSGRNT